MTMMVPEPWSRDTRMSPDQRAFYEYHACLMEPWDGPASLAFTDGVRVGATLDRNGLRPGRYWVTRDGRVVMASESGVLDIPARDVVAKGRLRPGRMFLVDTSLGRIVGDDELKAELASAQPYGQWVRDSMVALEDLPGPASVIGTRPRDGAPAPARVRLHHRGRAADHRRDGGDRRRPHRLDGQRRAARGPQRAPAAPVQLLQAALRAGHQPAGRRDPRGADHGHGPLDRSRGQPARARARRRPPGRAPLADPVQRGAGDDPGARRRPDEPRLPDDHAADPVQGGGQRLRPPPRDRGPPPPGVRGDRRGLQPGHPVRPRPQRVGRPDPGAPRRVGRPSPPGPQRDAGPGRPRPRVRASRARPTTSAC